MRWPVSIFACVLACFAPGAAFARTGESTRPVTMHPEGPARDRGIGPVRLEERQSNVARALGAGYETESSIEGGETYAAFDYKVGSITLEVAYVDGLVAGVDTKSPAVILFGHPLGDGLKTFRRVLRHRRGWRIDQCHHRAFTALAPGGPGTGIEWKDGRVKLVMIDVGGVLDDCALL